jgi:ankyrin repeat protein
MNQQETVRKLVRLAEAGQLEDVGALLQQGVPINATDADNATALYYAASRGHLELTEFLLQEGADPNIAFRDGITPMMNAAKSGHTDVIGWLLAYGGDPLVSADGATAATIAAMFNHRETEVLLNRHMISRSVNAQFGGRNVFMSGTQRGSSVSRRWWEFWKGKN